jgi:hypothetical protein
VAGYIDSGAASASRAAGACDSGSTPGEEMLIPIGDSLSGCPNRAGPHRLAGGAFPYLGVSCPVGGLITCERVGTEPSRCKRVGPTGTAILS